MGTRLVVLGVVLAVVVGALLGLVTYANDVARRSIEGDAQSQETPGEASRGDAGAARTEDGDEEDEGTTPHADPALSGWVEEADGTQRYYDPETHEMSVGWREIDGARHYFDEDGRKVTGWVRDEQADKTYWVKPEDGLLASHEWVEIDGVYQAFDDDGSWVTLGEVIPPDDELNLQNLTWSQQAVIDACDTTPWPGKGLCAGWISSVFANAGVASVGGDACDMARAWCTSSELADLKPGMIIAVTSHGRTDAGRLYGHICVYIGGGLIRDSGTYGLRKSSLGSWLAWFGDKETPKWGWTGGVDLSAV